MSETEDNYMFCDNESDYQLMSNEVSINDLPYVVFEYILSHLSPYKELIDCKLVSKSWRLSVIATIDKLRRDFTNSLINQSIQWSHLWPSSGPSISPRYSHSACCLGDSMYVFGGCTIANTTFNDLWRFDLCSRIWIRPISTGTFPAPKACASLVEYKDKLILFGGWTHSSPYPIHQEWRIFSHIHLFDTTTDRWSSVVPRSYSPAIAGHSASIIGHQMIVFGGLQSQVNTPSPFSSSNDIWVLSLSDFVWHKQKASQLKPLPRYGHSQVVLDDRHILIFGGSGGPNMLFSDIWMLCIPEDRTKEWEWRPIDIINKDSIVNPSISFHPTCKIGNLVVMLSAGQKVRSVQCKDGTIFRKPSIRCQYVSTSDNNNSTATTSRLEPQSSPQLPSASTSSSSSSQSSQNNSRPFSRKNRQRQLEGLDRMEQRLRQLKTNTSSPLAVKNTTIKSNMELSSNPMQLFVLDISEVLDTNTVKWVHKNYFINEGPEEVILYSLVNGKNEIIMFGGIQKDKNMKQNQTDNTLNNIPDIVSNRLHIITVKRNII